MSYIILLIILLNLKAVTPARPNIRSILPLKFGRKNGILLQWDVDFDDIPIECVNISSYHQEHYSEIISKEICKFLGNNFFLA